MHEQTDNVAGSRTTGAGDRLTEFVREVSLFWGQLPRKTLFFSLLVLWLGLFHFLGNSTFGYLIGRVRYMQSLFSWLYNAYTAPLSDDGHGLIMPLIILGLFYWKRRRLLAAVGEPWDGGLVLVGLAGLLHVIGYVIQQPRVSVLAMFLGIYGLMGAVWGRRWLAESFFPFFLVLFCIPLGSLSAPISFRLRLVVTKCVTLISHYVFGIEVIREGTRIFTPERTFEYEVAAACSGIRSLIAIVAVSTIYAWVSFDRWRSRLALIAAGIPLAVVGNVCRMMLIVLVAEAAGQEAGVWVHENAILSLIPYVPAFLGLGVIGYLIRRWWEDRLGSAHEK